MYTIQFPDGKRAGEFPAWSIAASKIKDTIADVKINFETGVATVNGQEVARVVVVH